MLENIHLNLWSRQIKDFIEAITEMPMQVVDNQKEWTLIVGVQEPIKFGYNKHRKGNLDDRQLKFMTYTNMLNGILEALKTPDRFLAWKQREKTAKN